MERSNFLDEVERHAELYSEFTPRQQYLIGYLESPRMWERYPNPQSNLEMVGVSEEELRWLHRTGRLR